MAEKKYGVTDSILRILEWAFGEKKAEKKQPEAAQKTGEAKRTAEASRVAEIKQQVGQKALKAKKTALKGMGKKEKKRRKIREKKAKHRFFGAIGLQLKKIDSLNSKLDRFESIHKKRGLLPREEKTKTSIEKKISELQQKVLALEVQVKKQGMVIPEKLVARIQKIAQLQPESISKAMPEKPLTLQGALEKELELAFIHTDEELENAIGNAERALKTAKIDFKKGRITEEEYNSIAQSFTKKLGLLKEKKKQLEKESGIEKVAEKFARHAPVDNSRLEEIESHVGSMLEKYNVSMDEIERDVDKLDKEKILLDFHKLINVIDIFREATDIEGGMGGVGRSGTRGVVMARERNPALDIIPAKKKKKEKLLAIAKDIKKYRIVTDFDRLLGMVQEKGSISSEQITQSMGISEDYFEELAEVLEKNGLVKIVYPPIGNMMLVDINFTPQKGKEKKGIMHLITAIKEKRGQSGKPI